MEKNLIINEHKLQNIKKNLLALNIKLDYSRLEKGPQPNRMGILSEPINKQPEPRRFLPNLLGGNLIRSMILFVKSMYKYLIVIPIVVFIVLYVKKPQVLLTKNKKTNETKLDTMKLRVATALVTLVLYAFLFIYFRKYRQG